MQPIKDLSNCDFLRFYQVFIANCNLALNSAAFTVLHE